MPSFKVTPSVVPQARDTPLGCWVAGLAILYNWKYPVPGKTQKELAKQGGLEFEDYYSTGLPHTTDPATDKFTFLIKTYKLAALPPQTYTLEGWRALLEKHGPLAIVVDATKPNDRLTHLAILQGIEWQNGFSDAKFHLVDTANANAGSMSATQFSKILETPDVVERTTMKGFAMP
jgi:hypothetical protein